MLLAEWCRQWFQMWKSRRHSTHAKLFMNLPWKYRLSVCFTLSHTFQTLRFHSIAPSCVQSFFRASGGHGPETAPAFQASLPPERAGFRLNKCLCSCCRYKSTCRYFTSIAMNSWCDLDITGLHEQQVLYIMAGRQQVYKKTGWSCTYLRVILTVANILTYTLTFYLNHHLTYFLTVYFTFYLTYILTFFLAPYLTHFRK